MTLNALLDETAARFPDRIALAAEVGDWTFRRLRERVLKAAAAFHARGVRKGDCVAIVLRNSPEFIIAYFGLARLGAVAVPINFLIQKAEELRFMLGDCSAVGVVTQKDFLPGLLKARQSLPDLRFVWATDGPHEAGDSGDTSLNSRGELSEVSPESTESIENFRKFVDGGDPGRLPDTRISPDDVAAILYTSGTTGMPKGVMLSHGNLVSNCDASLKVMRFTERDVALTILPMFHTFAWTACVLIAIRTGAKNVIAGSIAPAAPWLKRMGRHGVTVFAAVPPVYSVLAKEACGFKRLVLRWWFFRKVRFCVSGAAPLNQEVAQAFRSALGLDIMQGYGLTETSPVATINPPEDNRSGTVGRPIEGVRVKIIRDDESELPAGEEGEVCIKGPNVMLGYHGNPEATRQAFTKDGYFKSGDIGVLGADGYLSLRDRKKDMIIVKGLKVFSAQVEAVLAAHPDVEEAAVVGVPDATGDEVIKAFVTLRPAATADKSAILQYCRQKLDAYKRPRDVEIVRALPKNALQKVLKRVLRQQELDKRK